MNLGYFESTDASNFQGYIKSKVTGVTIDHMIKVQTQNRLLICGNDEILHFISLYSFSSEKNEAPNSGNCVSLCQLSSSPSITVAFAAGTRISILSGETITWAYSVNTGKNIKQVICLSSERVLVFFETKELEVWNILESQKKREDVLPHSLAFSAFTSIPTLNVAFGAFGSDIYMWSLPSSCNLCNNLGTCGCRTNQYRSPLCNMLITSIFSYYVLVLSSFRFFSKGN